MGFTKAARYFCILRMTGIGRVRFWLLHRRRYDGMGKAKHGAKELVEIIQETNPDNIKERVESGFPRISS